MLFSITLIITFCILCYFIRNGKPNNYPPGPKGFPIIGSIFHLKQLLKKLGYYHLVWDELGKTYGPIVSLKMGSDFLVTITDAEAIKEVLTRPEFQGRPHGLLFRVRTFEKRLGILFTDGPIWQTHRRFSLQHLRDLGFGKHQMELFIAEEAKELIEVLRNKSSVSMHNVFTISTLNVIWTMISGQRFDLNDSRLLTLLNLIHSLFKLIDQSGGLMNQMPFLRYVAPKAIGYSEFKETSSKLVAFIKEAVTEHRKNLSVSHSQDLIDSYLQKMNEASVDETFTEEQLISICIDLFMAGSETTSNTLGFSMLYMAKYPHVQKKVQAELDEVVGRNRWPILKDKTSLPYTEAVLMEIQRMANIVPSSVAHRATCDTKLLGYNIPKNAMLLANIYSVHMDNDYWKDPLNFRPERFLTDNGTVFTPEMYFFPFSYGKRRCLGETLAKTSYFLFFTAMLHNFHLGSDGKDIDLDGLDGITISPKPFEVKLTSRTS